MLFHPCGHWGSRELPECTVSTLCSTSHTLHLATSLLANDSFTAMFLFCNDCTAPSAASQLEDVAEFRFLRVSSDVVKRRMQEAGLEMLWWRLSARPNPSHSMRPVVGHRGTELLKLWRTSTVLWPLPFSPCFPLGPSSPLGPAAPSTPAVPVSPGSPPSPGAPDGPATPPSPLKPEAWTQAITQTEIPPGKSLLRYFVNFVPWRSYCLQKRRHAYGVGL